MSATRCGAQRALALLVRGFCRRSIDRQQPTAQDSSPLSDEGIVTVRACGTSPLAKKKSRVAPYLFLTLALSPILKVSRWARESEGGNSQGDERGGGDDPRGACSFAFRAPSQPSHANMDYLSRVSIHWQAYVAPAQPNSYTLAPASRASVSPSAGSPSPASLTPRTANPTADAALPTPTTRESHTVRGLSMFKS
jgi:hypothetical protein